MSLDLRECAFETPAFMTEAGHQRPRGRGPFVVIKGLLAPCTMPAPEPHQARWSHKAKPFIKTLVVGDRATLSKHSSGFFLRYPSQANRHGGHWRANLREWPRSVPVQVGREEGRAYESHQRSLPRPPGPLRGPCPALLGPARAATAFWRESTPAPLGKGAGTRGGAQTSAEM